jgi:YYY domain-containing protein
VDGGETGSLGALARWLLALQILSLACFGLLARGFGATRDAGYTLAKLAAWLAPGTVVWLLASTGLAPNAPVTARAVAALLVLAGGLGMWVTRRQLADTWRQRRPMLLAVEGSFLACFGAVLVVRAFNPAIFWGEKPMDFAILNACLRAVSFPPADPWYAGEPLNYFYFGHAVTAVFAQLTGVGPAFAFNIALATVAGLLGAAACGALLQASGRVRAGAFGALLVVAAGNLAGPRAMLVEAPSRIGFDYYWGTSRVVPGTINEYPAWNLVFGDLHAHVLAMPLQVGLLYLGMVWLARSAGRGVSWPLLVTSSAWLLGAVAVTNPWSLPTVVVVQLGFLLTAWLHAGRSVRGLAHAIGAWAAIVVAAHLLFRPFWTTYAPAARSWGWITSEAASLGDALTVFGVFLALAVPVLAARVFAWARVRPERLVGVVVAVAAAASLGWMRSGACSLFAAWTTLSAAAWLCETSRRVRTGALLVGCAGGLGMLTEIVFVWDRMNTVFKFYLDMWLLLGVGAAVLAWWTWERASRGARIGFTAVTVPIVAAGLFTSVAGTAGYLRDPHAPSPVPTLDGLAYLEAADPSALEAYRWLNREVAGIPVILEAQGPPYQAFTRVSKNTGLPTVLGWEYHLVQQGRPQNQITLRAAEVRELYDTTDVPRAELLLRRYRIDLVYVGPLERRTYSAPGLAKFAGTPLLREVFRNREVSIYATPGRASSVKTWISRVPNAALVLPASAPRREPRGIAAAPDGTFVIADFGNRRLQRVGPDLQPVAAYGREGEAPGEFKDPCGVAVGDDGTLWVADTWNHRVQKLSPDGAPIDQLQAGFYGPRGVALAPDGAVYVSDTGNGRIVRLAAGSEPRVLVDRASLREPVGIAVDRQGEIYVADPGAQQLAVFDPEGRPLRRWPVDAWRTGARMEPALAVGPDDVVWATDPAGGRVLLFDRLGAALGTAIADEPLEQPLGIAVVAPDAAVVTDAATGRLITVRRPPAATQGAGATATGAGEVERLQTPTRKSPAR